MIETIDFSKSEQYTLSIRLSADGFSFSVFNPLGNDAPSIVDRQVDESLSLTANLKMAFREVEWLKLPYRKVNVLMSSRRFTLMPLEYFEDEQAETVFYHNHPKINNEEVRYNILRKNNVVVLFGIDKSTQLFVCEQHPNTKFYSQASALIEHFSIKSRMGNSRKMYAHIKPKAIDIYCYDRNSLLLANSFECRHTADRIYFMLYVWKQLGFDQERDELHLTGNLLHKEALLGELRKLINQVFVMNPTTNLDLQAITSCE